MCNHIIKSSSPLFQRLLSSPGLHEGHKHMLRQVYEAWDRGESIPCVVPLIVIIDDLLNTGEGKCRE